MLVLGTFPNVILMVAVRSHGCVLLCFNFLDNKFLLSAYKLISVHDCFFLRMALLSFSGCVT